MDTINFIPMPIDSNNTPSLTKKEWLKVFLIIFGSMWFVITIMTWLTGDDTLVNTLKDQWEFLKEIPHRIW